jgi:hypothetical protein
MSPKCRKGSGGARDALRLLDPIEAVLLDRLDRLHYEGRTPRAPPTSGDTGPLELKRDWSWEEEKKCVLWWPDASSA